MLEYPYSLYVFILVVFIIIYVYWLVALSGSGSGYCRIEEGLNEVQGVYCPSCEGLSFNKCITCYNCGFKSDGYMGKCVPGEFDKPFNKKDVLALGMQTRTKDKFDDNMTPKDRWVPNDTFWRNLYRTADVNNYSSDAFEENRPYNDLDHYNYQTCTEEKKPVKQVQDTYIIERNTGTPINVTGYGKWNRDCVFPAFN